MTIALALVEELLTPTRAAPAGSPPAHTAALLDAVERAFDSSPGICDALDRVRQLLGSTSRRRSSGGSDGPLGRTALGRGLSSFLAGDDDERLDRATRRLSLERLMKLRFAEGADEGAAYVLLGATSRVQIRFLVSPAAD